MEQAWTNDRYDVPRGDLEFWARRHGNLPAANGNELPPAEPDPAALIRLALRRLAAVAWLAILLGLAMQGFVLAAKASIGTYTPLPQVAIDLAQGITWAFFVCAGIGVGTTIAKANTGLGGLIGMIAAPLALGLARGSQKFMTSALGASAKPAILPFVALGPMRAIEYGVLGWWLAWLAARQEERVSRYLTAGAVVGIAFGGTILALTVHVAAAKGIALSAGQILSTAINEMVFPAGCALVVWTALQVAGQVRLLGQAVR